MRRFSGAAGKIEEAAMMAGQQFDEKLAAIRAEAEALKGLRAEIIAEIGEKALAELSDRPEIAELVAKVSGADEKAEGLKKKEEELAQEKLEFERAERERIAKRTCIRCKALNPEDARFCEGCGQELGVLPREYCKNCGTMNPPGLKFCGECGTKLGD